MPRFTGSGFLLWNSFSTQEGILSKPTSGSDQRRPPGRWIESCKTIASGVNPESKSAFNPSPFPHLQQGQNHSVIDYYLSSSISE